MLFPYTYVQHQMDAMQTFIDFIFHEVWCNAPINGPFGLNLFDANVELREVMEAFHYSDAKGAYFFNGHVERIHGLFSSLTNAQINQLREWYEGNNDLEKLCANDPNTHLVRYADIAAYHEALASELGTFFKGLYSETLLDLAALRAKIGDIDDHYQAFVRINNAGKCPFCGIGDLMGEHHSKREAYDHYLPKALYPFNSINFRNLVPACHNCNSSYKGSKNPAFTPKDPTLAARRRAVFYPFGVTEYTIELSVNLRHSDIETLTPDDISIHFGPLELAEQIDTWRDIYGIDERYKAKLIGKNDGKYWLEQVLFEVKNHDQEALPMFEERQRQAEIRPYADCNFLRVPFLNACRTAGIF